MAKRPVKKISPTDKKIAALVKRMKALENQSFAQKLLIDDLGNKLEQAENTIKRLDNPYQIQVPYQTSAPQSHSCSGCGPDLFGCVTCVICGKLLYYTITTTTSSDSTISVGTMVSASETLPLLADSDIEIVWSPLDFETKE
jgi:hypothetical protein